MHNTKLMCKALCLFLVAFMLVAMFPFSAFASDIITADFTETIEISYINNDYSGKYLRNLSGSPNASSGLLSSLGTTIQWQITPVGDDMYTIKPMNDTTKYLTGSSTASSTTVQLSTLTGTTIPDHYKWYITIATGGGCLIQNVHTEKYLYANGSSIYSSSTLGTAGTTSYRQRVWRIADTSYYGNTSAHSRIELPNGYSFKTLTLFAGDSKQPDLLDEYDNVLWRTADNFTFSGFNTAYVTLNSTTGTFTASTSSALYSTNIVATHKVTGRTTTFTLVINPKAALVGVSNAGHNHSSALTNIVTDIRSCGFSSANVYTGAFTTNAIDSHLDSDANNVFVSRSHGGRVITSSGSQLGTTLLLNDNEDNQIFYHSYQSIKSLDLTNMTLVMFIGCETAAGGEGGLNLPTVAVEQGARTSVGFRGSIDCATANNWTEDFFDLIKNGLSVSAACAQLAANNKYAGTGLATFEICGYDYTRLK